MSKTKWTTDQIGDQGGKVIIVTGGNSGLGFESVKALASKGADVVLASRSLEKGRVAIEKIGKVKGKLELMQLDLQDFASIKAFANEFKNKYDQLDILMNNAGIMTTPYFTTKDGLEGQMGTNHFGHFALTGQLLDLLIKTKGSRVVNTSSSGHKAGKMDFDNLLYEGGEGYSRMGAYGRSKLANLLFTYELNKKFEANGIDSISVAAHPGVSKTNLDQHINGKWWFKLIGPLFYSLAQDASMGALPQIRAAVDPKVKGGEYYGPKNAFSEMGGYPQLVQSNKASHNKEDAQKLWEISEKITGITYSFGK